MSEERGQGREVEEHLAKDAGLLDPGDDTVSHLSEDAGVPAEVIEGDDGGADVPASFATGGFVPPGRE